MSEDFLRLVSQANPATRRYQPAHNGYPPSSSTEPYLDSPQPMDPFFDDDDENMPYSAFGRPAPMQSQESGLPLTSAAAPPAGSGTSKQNHGDVVPQGWNFDDDDFHPPGQSTFPGSEHYPSKPLSSPTRKWEWKWKWPWQKEKELTGERVITLNNSSSNSDFCSNSISTSKYNLVSFVPKFLTGTYFPLVSYLLSLLVYRTIFKIRQSIFSLHRLHPANSRRVSHKQIYYHRSVSCRPLGICV